MNDDTIDLIRLYFDSACVECADDVERRTGLPWSDCIKVYAAIQDLLQSNKEPQ